MNEPDCDVLTCDEIEGTYFHLDGGLVSFVEHDDSDHVTVLVRDPRDGTIIDDDSGIDLGDGKFKFAAAGNAWLENGILHFEKPGSMSEWVKYQDRAMPDTTTTDTTTTTVTATTVTTVEPTKGTRQAKLTIYQNIFCLFICLSNWNIYRTWNINSI